MPEHSRIAAQGRGPAGGASEPGTPSDTERELRESRHQLQLAREALRIAREELRAQGERLLALRDELETEQARYREIFESAPDGYLLTDLAGTIREANRTAGEQLQTAPAALAGRSLLDFVHPEDRRPFRTRLLARLGQARRRPRWELRMKPPGRRSFVAALTVSPVQGPAGEPEGWRFLVRDVSERRDAEARYARLLAREQEAHAEAEAARARSELLAEVSAVLASSLDYGHILAAVGRLAVPRLADYCLILERDGQGDIRQASAVHADPEKEPLLAGTAGLYGTLVRHPESRLARALRTGEPQLVREVAAAPAIAALDAAGQELIGQRAPRSALVLPLAARGQVFGLLVLVACDDSGRSYGDADLSLGVELARRTAVAIDNARLYQEAREANAAKDQFLATLSHELRTPLTPVLAVSSALAASPHLPPEMRAELERVKRNVELEARLIDDLLDLTRIARGKLELHREVADVAELIEQALLTCCAEAVAAGRIAISTDLAAGDHRVWADAPRLTQVLWNLLNNAVKFTIPAGDRRHGARTAGRIAVRSWSEGMPDDPWVAIEVADEGIGIDPELLPRIFDGFEQGERSITRRFGGLGLGLAVSKAIAELHGGSLTAASAGPGRGATFTLRIPRGALPSPHRADPGAPAGAHGADTPRGSNPAPTPAKPAAELHILLVEDHADTAAAMADLLADAGHRVTVAGSIAEGLAAAEAAEATRPVDLLISDLGLPDGSGLDLMRELGRRRTLAGIALSGYGMEEDVRKSREAGFRRHLTKPVTFQTLAAAIAEATAETG